MTSGREQVRCCVHRTSPLWGGAWPQLERSARLQLALGLRRSIRASSSPAATI